MLRHYAFTNVQILSWYELRWMVVEKKLCGKIIIAVYFNYTFVSFDRL